MKFTTVYPSAEFDIYVAARDFTKIVYACFERFVSAVFNWQGVFNYHYFGGTPEVLDAWETWGQEVYPFIPPEDKPYTEYP